MNPVLETIHTRRSVRSYERQLIPKDVLRRIIDAGNNAPSGNNAQGWRFVVIENQTMREKLAALALPRYKAWMEKAPQTLKDKRADIDRETSDPVYYSAPVIIFVINSGITSDMDTPMACQNIMLAARSYGIGSCWVFFGQLPVDDPGIREILELKAGEKIYGPIALGYPKGGFPEAPEKKESIIKWA